MAESVESKDFQKSSDLASTALRATRFEQKRPTLFFESTVLYANACKKQQQQQQRRILSEREA